jgi:galactonate dehydratase
MDSLDDLAENAREAVKKGWTALKFDPFPGPWRLYITGKEEHLAVDRGRTVREAVGPDSAR